MNLEPWVLVVMLAAAGVAGSLTFAVWRAVTRPKGGEAFEEALEIVSGGTEVSSEEISLSVRKKEPWSWNEWWADQAQQAGREVNDPNGFGRAMLGVIVLGFIFGLLVYPTGAGAVLVPLLVVGAVWLWLSIERGKRRAAMERQLPMLLSSLRTQIHSGQTVQAALMTIAVDMPAPLGDEIRRVRDEVDVSIPLETALLSMADRVGSRQVQFLVSSIGIAIRSGSDLVPQLVTIEDIVRQRARIAGKIKSAVALAKPTAYLALAAPPAMALYMTLTSPGYWNYFLGDGLILLLITVVLYVLGIFSIKLMISNVEKY